MAVKFGNGIDLLGQKATNLADGSSASDAVTYGQLMNLINGLDFHPSVRAATTANIDLSAPGASIDGVALNADDRVLVKNQTDGTQNGPYLWNGAASAMTRTDDGVTGELSSAATFVVSEGTTKGTGTATSTPQQWTLATPDPITVGTTSLTFNQSGAAGQTYTAGNGITISSGAIAVQPATGGGISVGSDGVSVDGAIVVSKFAANVGDGTSTSIAVTHGLGTRDVTVELQDSSTHAMVITDWVATDTNTVTLTFATAPASNAYRVVVHG